MKITNVNQVAKYAMNNKGFLELSNIIGCYYCLKMLELKEIKDWTDRGQTAICPHCSIDAVIGDSCGYEITDESLKEANHYWFG